MAPNMFLLNYGEILGDIHDTQILFEKKNTPVRSRAEDDAVASAGRAGEGAGPVVVGVAVGLRALVLEELRVPARPAPVRGPVIPAAAVLVGAERQARAPAPHRAAIGRPHRQLRRARRVDVGAARHRRAAAGRRDLEGHVEAVDVADVVEVVAARAAERELGQRARRLVAGAAALEPPRAVTGRARQAAAAAGGAAVARPDAAGPGARDAAVLGLGAGLKLEAGGREGRPAGVRLHAGVDRLVAFVSEHERCRHCA